MGGILIVGQSSQDTDVVAAHGWATTRLDILVIYIVSSTRFLMLDANPTNKTPGITIAEQWGSHAAAELLSQSLGLQVPIRPSD